MPGPWETYTALKSEKETLLARIAEIDAQLPQWRNECLKILGQLPTDLLTGREQQILELLKVDDTLQDKEIAAKLNITTRTVKFHMSNMFSKFSVSNRRDLLRAVGVC